MKYSHRSGCSWYTTCAVILLVAIVGFGSFADDTHDRMVFLQFADPVFRTGLEQHNLLGEAGYRVHNTGFHAQTFGERWRKSPLLDTAQSSGRPYYIDRIMGGMPYQSLEGIDEIATRLKDDPNFLGFQAHEWGNSPTHDYHRIHRLILEKGKELNKENFSPFEGSTATPYFSAGDFSIYQDLYRELATQEDVEGYLSDYFKKLVALTDGQLVSVTGYGQLHHTALRLGAKNVMAEIGNQVPLTAIQIACARGAARQHGKPFGAYYEPWGGSPMGCVCATDFSPWWPLEPKMKARMDGYNIGPKHGSSRSLQRRLLYYAWLSGAAWWSEEWGAENYFSNWEDYPITAYGRIVQEFQEATRGITGLKPVVPMALVTPPDTFGIDIRYVAGHSETLWRIAPADAFHGNLRRFAKAFFATQGRTAGSDSQNLTPSPWIGCFDVLDADAPASTLEKYAGVVYFDAEQAATKEEALLFDDSPETNSKIKSAIHGALPYHVEGRVGVAQARANGRYLIGVFNNLGITKTLEGEAADPAATQSATVQGNTTGMNVLVGETFVTAHDASQLELTIPAGEVVVLSFPDE
ncbi:MAG: hypothetical protein L3K26_11635 [Candidatus Hydrogenedentes bacterium]|nr:hypothetical protein [Candidatus Hydrogenedentota bacterium]